MFVNIFSTMDGQTDGRMDGRMDDGRTDGQKNQTVDFAFVLSERASNVFRRRVISTSSPNSWSLNELVPSWYKRER